MRHIIRLLRPKQWTKNLLIFAAPLFVIRHLPEGAVQNSLLTFASMCLLSSSVYVLNDLLDAERDRQHPIKAKRPIASGAVPPGLAALLAAILFAAVLG